MVGPSGMDAAAPPAPQMIGDPFRVVAALSTGDHQLAAELVIGMSDDDLAVLRPVAMALEALTGDAWEARRRAAVLAQQREMLGDAREAAR